MGEQPKKGSSDVNLTFLLNLSLERPNLFTLFSFVDVSNQAFNFQVENSWICPFTKKKRRPFLRLDRTIYSFILVSFLSSFLLSFSLKNAEISVEKICYSKNVNHIFHHNRTMYDVLTSYCWRWQIIVG